MVAESVIRAASPSYLTEQPAASFVRATGRAGTRLSVIPLKVPLSKSPFQSLPFQSQCLVLGCLVKTRAGHGSRRLNALFNAAAGRSGNQRIGKRVKESCSQSMTSEGIHLVESP